MHLMMVLVALVLFHAGLETNQEAVMMGAVLAGMRTRYAIHKHAVFL